MVASLADLTFFADNILGNTANTDGNPAPAMHIFYAVSHKMLKETNIRP